MLADDRRAWQLGSDDRWRRSRRPSPSLAASTLFETLMSVARASMTG